MKKQQNEKLYTPVYKANGKSEAAAEKNRTFNKKLWTVLVLSLVLVVAVVASLSVALHTEVIPGTISSTSTTYPSSDGTITNVDFSNTFAGGKNLSYPLVVDSTVDSSMGWRYSTTSAPQNVTMGVVDIADWDNVVKDLTSKGIVSGGTIEGQAELAHPGYPDFESRNDNDTRAYMIKKTPAAQSDATYVVSGSFSISSGKYMKVSVWVYTKNIVGEDGAYIAIKKTQTGTSDASYRVIYNVTSDAINNAPADAKSNGWTRFDFYLEGSKTSSSTAYLELGLGKSSSSAYGFIMFGWISTESISHGEFIRNEQKILDSGKNYISYSYDTDETNSQLVDWDYSSVGDMADLTKVDVLSHNEYMTMAAESVNITDPADAQLVMPFADDEAENILKLERNTANDYKSAYFGMFKVTPPSINNCYRASLWVRTVDIDPRSGAYIYLNAYYVDDNGDLVLDETLSKNISAYFKSVNTSHDILNDTNNGWSQYQFYIQPSEDTTYYLQIQVTVGIRKSVVTTYSSGAATATKNFATEESFAVTGSVYMTEFALEELEQYKFNTVSSSSTVVTASLKSVTNPSELLLNGSFNNAKTSAPNTNYPVATANWISLYAGLNTITENYDATKVAPNNNDAWFDMTNDENPESVYSSIGGIVYRSQVGELFTKFGITESDFNSYKDDNAHSLLMIYNNVATAHGYQSDAITLSANSFYRFSVLAKGIGGAVPYIYLTNGKTEVYACLTNGSTSAYVSESFASIDADLGNGWVRYYVYFATGDNDLTVNLELWNGKRDAKSVADYQLGTVLFDRAECTLLSDLTEENDTVSKEFMELFKNNNVQNAVESDLNNVYADEQLVNSNNSNLAVKDYRYNDVLVENDFNKIVEKAAELKTHENDDDFENQMTALKAMVETFNTKHYPDATSGSYYIDWENNSNIQALNTHLAKILSPADDTADTDTKTETEPVDWLLISSLVVTIAMLGAIVAIIIRKFASTHKKSKEEIYNNYQG